ncbi:YgjV family protein [Xylanimonas ulmi]|uniref:Inner membrane protein n=1 Tax=Xylanimonas ulmi TaxID=228973 RepID=A0A4Q7M1Y9_9MICO|nr:YgjV family protein [Xylanibacterium ulmi]RZS60428.1 inner membrane protein [Xylanibacterium ulmi]
MNPWLEAIGWLGSILVVLSLTQARVLRFRWLNLTGSVIATVYNAVVGIWPFVAMNAAIALINVYWLWRLHRTRHDAATYEVVEVAPDDAYLLHVLRTHAEDIAHFAPAFAAVPGDGERRSAFLVQRGDETVGVVEVGDAGNGTGVVLLDWVSRRFRDFTPGEFVYRRSGVFAAQGFTRLLVPPTARADERYLTRVGFVPADGGWIHPVTAEA